MDELWLLKERECNYDSDRDDVLKPEFENHLELDSKIFILETSVAVNSFVTECHWPEQLFPDAMRFPVELVNQVLNEVWGDGEGEDSDDMVIGTVLGTHITRTVTICRRKSKVAVA